MVDPTCRHSDARRSPATNDRSPPVRTLRDSSKWVLPILIVVLTTVAATGIVGGWPTADRGTAGSFTEIVMAGGAIAPPAVLVSTPLTGSATSPPVYETGSVVATVPVGAFPYGAAYDSGNGDVYVSNYLSNDVSVISGTTNTVVATVPVGSSPLGVGYDDRNGDVYVANINSNNVSVISATTNTVVATVPVGSGPNGVAYDSGNGDVYVTNLFSNSTSVISGTTNTVVATVRVGYFPLGVGYDDGNGDLYVANAKSNNVSVISGATNTVVVPVPVGSFPWGVRYDDGNGEVYVADAGSNTTSVISGTTNTVVATVPVGNAPIGVAYDGGNGDVYVTNLYSNNVSVISGTTNTVVVAGVSVGTGPRGVGYDAGNGNLYVTNSGSDVVSVISTMLDVGTLSAAPTPALDVGQSRVLSAPVVGRGSGIDEVTSEVSPSIGLACSPGVPNNMSLNATCVASTAGTYTVTLTALDTLGNSVWTSTEVTVYSDPTVSVPVPTRVAADVSQTVVFATTATGGPGAYEYYSWSAPSGLGCAASTSNTLTCVPLAPVTSGTVGVNVTDTNLETSATVSTTYTASTDPSISAPTASPSSVMDVGQTTTLSVVATNGTGQASVYSWSGLPAGCASEDSVSLPCTPTVAGTYGILVRIQDSNGVNATSGVLVLLVAPSLGTPSVTASETSLTVGGALGFQVTVSGGSSPLTYAWSGLPAGCATEDGPVLTCTPTTAGTYTVSVTVTDAAGVAKTATASAVTVNAAPVSSFAGGTNGLEWTTLGLSVIALACAVVALLARGAHKGRG